VLQLNLTEEKLSLEERQERLSVLVSEIEELKTDLEGFEVAAESLYEHTAEARAGRLSNMWWLLNLTFFKVTGEDKVVEEFQPFFVGKKFDDKMEAYSILEERIAEVDDKFVDFEVRVIEKASYLLSAWNGGNVKVFKDFEKVEESLDLIRNEVKEDEGLQVIYEQKVRELAGIEMEISNTEEEKEGQSEEKEPDEEQPEEKQPDEEKPEEKPEEKQGKESGPEEVVSE
jgi:hypothetical protein